ncbi:MAG TPA: carbon storage regulator [Candidatus Baltobacteraceae bacterium]
MLRLTRKIGESVVIGDDVRVTIVAVDGRQVQLGIEAPADVRLARGEIHDLGPKGEPDPG